MLVINLISQLYKLLTFLLIIEKILKSYLNCLTKYFWIEGSQPDAVIRDNTDHWAICNKYISITDISVEFERKNVKNNHSLEKWINSLNDYFLN